MGAYRDMDIIADPAIMIYRCASVDNTSLSDPCARIDHRTSHHNRSRTDLHIPLLADYIKVCKKYGKVCVLEVKNPFSEDALCRMIKEIAALDYLDRVTFISFDWNNCVVLRRMLPTQQIQWLTSEAIDDEVIQKLVENHLDLDVHYYQLNREVLSKLHAAGITVNCWTCDNPEKAYDLVNMGVDFITSNILE